MNKEKVKNVDSINSELAIQAIELSEIADKLSSLFIDLECKNAASVSEHLINIEIMLTNAYLNISDVMENIDKLNKD